MEEEKGCLDSVISRLESSTLDSFCAAGHDFLRLPQLLGTFCNHDYPKVKKVQSNPASEGAISRNKLDVGDFVSSNQFVCRTPGRLPSRYGSEGVNSRFNGGTIYNDAASGLIWVENQVSLDASETFEQWLYDIACVEFNQ
jgi:hypothetical protein